MKQNFLKKISSFSVLAAGLILAGCNSRGILYDLGYYQNYKAGKVHDGLSTLPPAEPVKKPEAPFLQFFAVGCAGSGNEGQRLLARSMTLTNAEDPTDLVLYMGDNFYGRGVSSVRDPKWKTCFEDIFDPKALAMPFYAALGNHDHFKNPDAQIEYARNNPRWRMPARYYSFERALKDGTRIEFFGLDTVTILTGNEDQLRWLDEKLGASAATWKIVFGHHPVYSHALIHEKEVLKIRGLLEPVLIRGRADLYLAAHNHSIEVLREQSGVQYVVSGAGSRPRDVRWTEQTEFAHADIGFLRVRVNSKAMDLSIIGKERKLLFNKQVVKNK